MAGTYNHVKSLPNNSRMGGTQQKAYLCSYEDFLVLQQPDPDATDPLDRHKVTTAHTFASGKGFIEVYVTKDTGKLMLDTIGGADRHSFLAKGEFYHPGEGDGIVSFANQVVNDRFVMLIPLPGIPELIQIGGSDFQTEVKAAYDTTTNSGDGRGWLFSFECFQPYGMIKYTASTITLKS